MQRIRARGLMWEKLCFFLNSIQKCEHFGITRYFSPHSFTFWSSCTKYGPKALYSVISYGLATISRSFVSMSGVLRLWNAAQRKPKKRRGNPFIQFEGSTEIYHVSMQGCQEFFSYEMLSPVEASIAQSGSQRRRGRRSLCHFSCFVGNPFKSTVWRINRNWPWSSLLLSNEH